MIGGGAVAGRGRRSASRPTVEGVDGFTSVGMARWAKSVAVHGRAPRPLAGSEPLDLSLDEFKKTKKKPRVVEAMAAPVKTLTHELARGVPMDQAEGGTILVAYVWRTMR